MRRFHIGPIARISAGLTALLISMALLVDMLLGVVPSQGDADHRVRKRVAENLALQMTSLLEAGDTATLDKTIQHVMARDTEIQSIGVRRSDGSTIAQHGQAEGDSSTPLPRAGSTVDHLRVPIFSDQRLWGEVEVKYARTGLRSVQAWITQPIVKMMVVFALGGFGLCYLYLRRAMQYLNPSASVPDRVRKAFDSLTDGLVIVDHQARIVLANRAFRRLHPQADAELNGQRIDALDWLLAGRAEASGLPMPWVQTLQSANPVSAQPLDVLQPDGPPTRLLVSSAPIMDSRGRSRGCLINFDDVTATHRANDELREMMAQLKRSHQRIEEQNDELRRLASRDPLTNCLNRRAFFETAGDTFETVKLDRSGLCCLMVDIDHFKQFNDRHGHAVGDQVIQVVARFLTMGLRQVDLVCRYGGEEFCVVLPGATQQVAETIAERMRVQIEERANEGLRGLQTMPITVSMGLACLTFGANSLKELIDQADQALYRSKQAGRNRVTTWERPAASACASEAKPA